MRWKRLRRGLSFSAPRVGDIVGSGAGSLLLISKNARVQGKVMAGHVIINVQVHGPEVATSLLELQPEARIVGDVQYDALEMHQSHYRWSIEACRERRGGHRCRAAHAEAGGGRRRLKARASREGTRAVDAVQAWAPL